MACSFEERLRASFDPLQGRRLLETGVRPAARRRRRYEDLDQRTKGEAK